MTVALSVLLRDIVSGSQGFVIVVVKWVRCLIARSIAAQRTAVFCV